MNPPANSYSLFFPAIFKLLRLRWQINWSSFRHASTRSKFWIIVGVAGMVSLAGLILWVSMSLLGFLESANLDEFLNADPLSFLKFFPTLIFSSMFLGILFTSFGVLLQALYLSGDMDFLLSSPVPIRAVFFTKLLQAVLPNFGLMALFGMPVLYGLGIASGYNFVYYPLVFVIIVVLALTAASISALLVMLVVKIFPARRVAEVLGFVGAIIAIVLSQSGNLSRSIKGDAVVDPGQINALMSMVNRFNSPWLPMNWAGQALVGLGEGRWLMGSLLFALTLAASLAVFWFSLVTAERWYYSGWAGMQVVTNHKKKSSLVKAASDRQPSLALKIIQRIFPAPVRAIIRRDYLIQIRDLRQLSQLITPMIFGIIYTFMILKGGNELPAGRGEAPAWFMETLRILLAYVNVGMSLFVGWMLLSRLAGTAVSREGKNYWMIKSSPLKTAHLLEAKFLVAFLPALGLGWIFVTVISFLQGISFGGYLYGLLAVAMCLAGMVGILLGFDAANANLKWEDPRKINSGRAGCFGTLLTMLFIPTGFGIFIMPVVLANIFQLPSIFGYLVGLFLGISVCLVSALLPLKLAGPRIAKLGEE